MSDWIFRLIDWAGPFGIFILMLLETVFPPIPSEIIMPLAGMRAAAGEFPLWSVIVAGTLGAMAGNLFWYALARWIGLERFRGLIEKHGRWFAMDWNDVEWVKRQFGRFGEWLVAIGRMVPTVRSVISIPAGLVHMHLASFLFWSTLGTAGWSALLGVSGWALGQSFGRVEEVAGPVSTGVIVVVVLLYVYRQLTWKKKKGAGKPAGNSPH